jgi:hypothetical protein
MKFEGVRATQLWRWEEQVKDLLSTVQIHDMSVDNILDFVGRQVLQLWILRDGVKVHGVLLTEIVHHPKHSILVLKYGAGKLPANAKKILRDIVIPWSKMYGCSKIEVAGRKGWKRVLGLTQEIPLYRGDI